MHCKACDCSIEVRDRAVQDENGRVHVMFEDLCNNCIIASQLKYSEDALIDIYARARDETFKVIR